MMILLSIYTNIFVPGLITARVQMQIAHPARKVLKSYELNKHLISFLLMLYRKILKEL